MKLVQHKNDVLPRYGLPSYFIAAFILYYLPIVYVNFYWIYTLAIIPIAAYVMKHHRATQQHAAHPPFARIILTQLSMLFSTLYILTHVLHIHVSSATLSHQYASIWILISAIIVCLWRQKTNTRYHFLSDVFLSRFKSSAETAMGITLNFLSRFTTQIALGFLSLGILLTVSHALSLAHVITGSGQALLFSACIFLLLLPKTLGKILVKWPRTSIAWQNTLAMLALLSCLWALLNALIAQIPVFITTPHLVTTSSHMSTLATWLLLFCWAPILSLHLLSWLNKHHNILTLLAFPVVLVCLTYFLPHLLTRMTAGILGETLFCLSAFWLLYTLLQPNQHCITLSGFIPNNYAKKKRNPRDFLLKVLMMVGVLTLCLMTGHTSALICVLGIGLSPLVFLLALIPLA